MARVARISAVWLMVIAPLAWGASIEQLVMPGPVVAGHADIESECSNCHAPFSQKTQRTLCLDCHEEIQADIQAQSGFHGLSEQASTADCKVCHTEHIGREGDIVGLHAETFDHNITDFALEGQHRLTACTSCHEADLAFREAPSECSACHQEDDAHDGHLGDSCGDCHSPAGWQETRFDHDETEFPLIGKHQSVSCGACHTTADYQAAETECVSCHLADDVHQGSRGTDCESCHTSEDWDAASFDHLAETGYALEGAHAESNCEACHGQAMALETPPDTCAGCHSGNDVHGGRRGEFCGDCHRQDTWKLEFDHEAESGFALTGRHGELACDGCHTKNFTEPLPGDCSGCHGAEDPHDKPEAACDDCHGTRDWFDDLRFNHDFTRFPLVGLHRATACEQCHATLAFADAPDQCSDCHESDDVHQGSQGNQCQTCHNPSSWGIWDFDHNTDTDFHLDGAHEELACEACHLPGRGGRMMASCDACHGADDPHDGGFGRDCARCHNTRDFNDVSLFD